MIRKMRRRRACLLYCEVLRSLCALTILMHAADSFLLRATSHRRRQNPPHHLFPNNKKKNGHRHPNDEGSASSEKDAARIPQHVAFICDGNSRWARQRNLPVVLGHAAGADRLVDVVLPTLQEMGVQYCTMYGFSTENWKRSQSEIDEIFAVIEQTAQRVYHRLQHEHVKVQILGDLEDPRIPPSLRASLFKLERDTEESCQQGDNEEPPQTLCLAINYGGRRDIVNAAKRLAQLAELQQDTVDNVFTEDAFSQLLSTRDVPDPDLVIRTSGESRLSNFLLWETAYAELYFTNTLWPDFDQVAMTEALDWYAMRKRRFGAREELLRSSTPLP